MKALKVLVVVFFLLDLFLAFNLFVGNRGLMNYLKLKRLRASLCEKTQRLREENIKLSREIRLMRKSEEFQRKMVREILHLGEREEIFYMVRR